MFVRELTVQRFRLLKDLRVELREGLNYFYGKNAQGKTSLLEALCLVSTGKSFVTHLPREMIAFGDNHFFIRTKIERAHDALEIKFGQDKHEKKVSVNGEPLKSLSMLLGKLDTVLFIPSDFDLVTAPPEIKRRYLDIQLSQASGEYLEALKIYNRVLKQRNALLKQAYCDRKELKTWTEELVSSGALLTDLRRRAVERIEKYSIHFLEGISGAKERLQIQYLSFLKEESPERSEDFFMERLRMLHEQERKLGYTLLGPHRDDLAFKLNGFDASRYASRGQLKSIAIALKFSESANLKKLKGYWPVLLIDDIFSELDEERQRAVFSFLEKGQQVVLSSNLIPSRFPFIHPSTSFEVLEGALHPEKKHG